MLNITFVNQVGLPDADVAAWLAAAQVYIDRDITPFYPTIGGSTIRLGTEGDYPLISAVPNTLHAGSLGFHTTSNGIASGCVEMDACQRYDVPWFTPAFHELAEMVRNPMLDQFAAWGDRSYPREICDPTTSSTYDINGLPAANFVTDAFWDASAPPGTRFDMMAEVTADFTKGVPPKGWMEWNQGGVYSNAWGPDIAPAMIAYMAERQGRRHRLRHGVQSAALYR